MLKTILVAIDESDQSDQVMRILRHVSFNSDTNVILTHVVLASVDQLDIASDRPDAELEDPSAFHLEKLKTYQSTLPCLSQLEVVSGDPAEEIVRLAHLYHADLIIMGSRGLTGFDRVLQGSVSSQVIEAAPCSVLVAKAELSQRTTM